MILCLRLAVFENCHFVINIQQRLPIPNNLTKLANGHGLLGVPGIELVHLFLLEEPAGELAGYQEGEAVEEWFKLILYPKRVIKVRNQTLEHFFGNLDEF